MRLRKINTNKNLEFFTPDFNSELSIPLAGSKVSAGFPSPAEDFLDLSIDLNKELVRNPSSTFYARVKGESMKGVGIDNGDLLVIDKSIEPKNNSIAVCFIDGEFTVKRIKIEKKVCYLKAENEDFKDIKVTEENEFLIWGIVLHVIKSFKI